MTTALPYHTLGVNNEFNKKTLRTLEQTMFERKIEGKGNVKDLYSA